MKITKLYLLIFSGLIIFLCTTAYLSKDASREVSIHKQTRKVFSSDKQEKYDNSKIIKFNHKLHIVDAEVKCEDCHTGAVSSVSLKDNLNPKKEV